MAFDDRRSEGGRAAGSVADCEDLDSVIHDAIVNVVPDPIEVETPDIGMSSVSDGNADARFPANEQQTRFNIIAERVRCLVAMLRPPGTGAEILTPRSVREAKFQHQRGRNFGNSA
jgi:hypothetical protein